MENNRLFKGKTRFNKAKTKVTDEELTNDELFNHQAKNQDICITHFQIYLINKGNCEDPKTYAKSFNMLDYHNKYNYLAYLLADENDNEINYHFNSEIYHYGKRNLLESFYTLRNTINLDLKLKTHLKEIDQLLIYGFLNHDYLKATIDISLEAKVLKLKIIETEMHRSLIPIFEAYGINDFSFDFKMYKHFKDEVYDLYVLDLNSICDKINIYY